MNILLPLWVSGPTSYLFIHRVCVSTAFPWVLFIRDTPRGDRFPLQVALMNLLVPREAALGKLLAGETNKSSPLACWFEHPGHCSELGYYK